jgi:hypothetical protein
MDNRAETVRIGELSLRIPGLSAGEGRALGAEVMRRVAERLPGKGASRSLSALDIKVKIPEGTPRHRLAETVADAILRGLK